MITKAQEKAIAQIKRLAEKEHGTHCNKYEFKEFTVSENEYFVSVVVEIGMIGDEGTMAEIYCRDRAHLFIGPRGGITYPVSKKMKDGSWKHYFKRFGGYSILQASLDQK
ncbi:MAG: hypothetical protein K6E30_08230 [Lachnospiraceae bacterium]|nr:hypothetical protein [Lachnospiraceae bacterium]